MKKMNEEDKLAKDKKENESKAPESDAHFDLADQSKEYVNLEMKDEELEHTGNFLQKLHLRNHSLTAKETIHEVYRPEEEIGETEPCLFSEEDEMIFNEVQKAVLEQDILSLRTNLHVISKTVAAYTYSFEEIEDYVDGLLDVELRSRITEESETNPTLAQDLKLFKEINQAILEKDVIQLRANLIEICDNESSHHHSVEDLDNYCFNNMEDQEREAFEQEMLNNAGLARDVRLFKEIDEAISEKDVISFRENLQNINESKNGDDLYQKRGIIPHQKQRVMWYAAASVILLIGINLTLRNHTLSNTELYNSYFQPFDSSIGVNRSAYSSNENTLNNALVRMNQKDYNSALLLFSDILQKDPSNPVGNFYIGMIRQIQGDYEGAIHSFTNVVKENDNLFVEQAQWYIGLCYLNRNEREKAIAQFRKIIAQKGFYQKKAHEILAKLE